MNDKTALWLYEISTDWNKPEWVKKLAERLLPRCEYVHYETHAKCNEPGEPCYLPNWNDKEDEQIQWVCFEHTVDAGFCRSCRQFCAGIESFDFGDHAGYCDNCGWELDREREREYDDEDEYFYMDDYD